MRHPRGAGAEEGEAPLKKFVIAGVASFMTLVGVVGIAQAQGKAGPNGSNNHGLCTAYFNGQKSGWTGDGPPPFSSLSSAAESYESSKSGTDSEFSTDSAQSSSEAASDVYNLCVDSSFDPKGIGGNPCHGRDPGLFSTCSN